MNALKSLRDFGEYLDEGMTKIQSRDVDFLANYFQA